MVSKFNSITILVSVLIIGYTSSQSINAKWPYDDSIPFPYPTPGPINIIPFQAKYVPTPTPLVFAANPLQLAVVRNDGSELIVRTSGSPMATATGGILFNDTYNFFECKFFWDLSLKPSADTILGQGAPLVAAAGFYNTKYGNLKKAMKKRDGIAQIVIQIAVVNGSLSNILFYPFQFAVQRVKNAGSSTIIFETSAYDWYFPPSLTHYYFAYPGMYTDPSTGKVYYSATVMVVSRVPRPVISYDQFQASFGFLLNKSRQSYSHVSKIVPKGKRPLAVANGVEYKLKL